VKVILITSALTFVPENYDDLILPLISHPSIQGLVVLENRNFKYLAQGFALCLSGAAPRLGMQLLKNYFSKSNLKREAHCHKHGKFLLKLPRLNSEETINLLKSKEPDWLLNARTRVVFKKELLEVARFGCLNIHHGLLPKQKGLMCDFWAHLEGKPFGFSLHKMDEAVDEGAVFKVVEVVSTRKNYLESIRLTAQAEAKTLLEFLDTIQAGQLPVPLSLTESNDSRFCKNPTIKDFYRLKSNGVLI
jgi:methionyl-tRNA formyltransferase